VTFHLVAAKRMVDVPRIRSVVEAILDVLDDKAAARR